LPALAADLVGRKIDLIVTGGGSVVALAAKAATLTIPVVFISGDDPVESGVETSMRPLRDTLSQLRLRELLMEVQDRVEQIVEGRDRVEGLVKRAQDLQGELRALQTEMKTRREAAAAPKDSPPVPKQPVVRPAPVPAIAAAAASAPGSARNADDRRRAHRSAGSKRRRRDRRQRSAPQG
jgi:hypothetical protein